MAEKGIGCNGQNMAKFYQDRGISFKSAEYPCIYILHTLSKFQGAEKLSEVLQKVDTDDVLLYGCPPLKAAQRLKELERTALLSR